VSDELLEVVGDQRPAAVKAACSEIAWRASATSESAPCLLVDGQTVAEIGDELLDAVGERVRASLRASISSRHAGVLLACC